MKRKLLINHNGEILAVLPVDHKWGKRDLDGGRYEKLVDDTEANLVCMRRHRMKVEADKLVMKPEKEWAEAIQAKTEQIMLVERHLLDQIHEGNVIENPDGSWNIAKALSVSDRQVR